MRRTAMAVVAAAVLTTPVAATAESGDVKAAEVTFTSTDGVVLRGTVLTPDTPAATRRPGIVMLGGAGNRGRDYLMPEARAYARHGIVTLVYDKRTVGYSLLRRDYQLLAEDALAGLRLLRARTDVDPDRAGLWALSEGAFVAPIAASRSGDVTFLVTVGAVGVTPAVQTAWAYGTYLEHAAVSGSLPDIMQGVAVRTAIGAGLFPEADFDPLPYWEKVRQPVLAQWGALDRDSLPRYSSRLIRDALRRGGNHNHAFRVVAVANHNLHRTADAGFDRLPDLPADYGDVEASWIADPGREIPETPETLETLETLETPAPIIAAPAWYERGMVQGAAVVALLIMFGSYAVIRVRLPRPARWLAVLGPTTIAGTLLYLLFLLATAAKVTGPVVLGRPLVWLALQLLAVATVAATVAVLLGWRRRPTGDRIRLGLLAAGGVLFVPWAVHWGLLVP